MAQLVGRLPTDRMFIAYVPRLLREASHVTDVGEKADVRLLGHEVAVLCGHGGGGR